MADNRPTLTVAPKRKPSFLNIHCLTGFAVGTALITTLPYAAPIGLAVGSWLGKRKMQHEEQFGKQVSPPSGWNLGTLFGGIGGMNVGIAAAGLTALAISTGGIGLVGWLGVSAVAAGFTALGGFIGGKIGKQFQKRQYKAAELEVMQHGEFMPQQQAPSPQQAHSMEQAPAMQKGKGQAASMVQASQQMNPQQLAQLQALAAQGQAMAPAQGESMTDKLGHNRTTGPQQR